MKESSYGISCLQTEVHVIQNPADKERLVKHNLERSIELAAHAVATEESRLLILPEAWLQGFVPNRRIRDWLKVCIAIPGPETEKLGEFCRRHGTYLAGTAFEHSDAWPNRMFNTAFIVGPSGDVELKYRQVSYDEARKALVGMGVPDGIAALYMEMTKGFNTIHVRKRVRPRMT